MSDGKKTPKNTIKCNKIITPPKTRTNVFKYLNDNFLIVYEVKYKTILGKRIKIMTPKQIFQRSSIALVEVKAGNTSYYLFGVSRKRNY